MFTSNVIFSTLHTCTLKLKRFIFVWLQSVSLVWFHWRNVIGRNEPNGLDCRFGHIGCFSVFFNIWLSNLVDRAPPKNVSKLMRIWCIHFIVVFIIYFRESLSVFTSVQMVKLLVPTLKHVSIFLKFLVRLAYPRICIVELLYTSLVYHEHKLKHNGN